MRDISSAVQEMLAEYPVLKKMIKIIHLKKMNKGFETCFATSQIIYGFSLKYEIKLNPIVFSKPNIQNFLNNVYESHYYSIKDIIYHEMGHCLQLFMLCETYKLSLNKYNYFNAYKYGMLIYEKGEKEFKNYFDKFFKMYNWDYCVASKHLGIYAIDNPLELLPECFNNYYSLKCKSNRTKEEEITLNFTKTIIDDYKTKYLLKFNN